MIDLEKLVTTLASLAMDEGPLTETLIFERLDIDVSGAKVLRGKSGEIFATYGARRFVDHVPLDLLVSYAPIRDVGVVFRAPTPMVAELDRDTFCVDRRRVESGRDDGYDIVFEYGGATIGAGVSSQTGEIAILSATRPAKTQLSAIDQRTSPKCSTSKS